MRIQPSILTARKSTLVSRSARQEEGEGQIAGDRWEPSGSMLSKAGLMGAGLALVGGSLAQPALAAPRVVPRFQPPPESPALVQSQPVPQSNSFEFEVSEDVWNLAPSSLPGIRQALPESAILPIFAIPEAEPAATTARVQLRPLAQSNSISCGQTSVAMAVNSIRGSQLTDRTIHHRYGLSLLGALNSESRSAGVQWKDAGNLAPSKWSTIEKALEQGLPVIVGLNGPQFSPSGRGHIVTIVEVEGEVVRFADPASGNIRETTKEVIHRSPSYPQGSFIFLPFRISL